MPPHWATSLLLLFISLSVAGISIASSGGGGGGDGGGDVCGSKAEMVVSCPVKCFKTDPVCGVNGVTYWCGCRDARCAGVAVEKLGFCQVGSVGGGKFSGQALLLVHIVWLVLLGFSVVFGLL